ncbi:hypothetical protein GGS21DRAFT_540604 [Xylaria nigripes]|nr:hypothetical protein GGS21DRAFT_540604 [Xylaria nigripes]
MANNDFMWKRRNLKWHQGQPIPPAFEPCKDNREEREYDLALCDPNRCFGKGVKDDPLVVWLNPPDRLDRDVIWAHNNFAKAIAKLLGFTHTWIIKGAHNEQYARDKEGRKILIGPNQYLIRDADMHITLRLGTDLYACRLASHAYVLLSERGTPERYMDELSRRFKTEGGDLQIEFWPWRSQRRRFLPKREVGLGLNWQAHANVGPYLDTYRPDSRRVRDTYTPRDKNTPPRDDRDTEILEGAMTPELAVLVSRCHAAYNVYKELHEEVAPMVDPPADKLRELHAMREQIVTMKREVYREAWGSME